MYNHLKRCTRDMMPDTQPRRFVIRMLQSRSGLPCGVVWTTSLLQDVPDTATFGKNRPGPIQNPETSPYFLYWDDSAGVWTRREPARMFVPHSGETLVEEIDFEILRKADASA